MRTKMLKVALALFAALIFTGHASAQLFWAGAGMNPATAGSGTWDNANMQWSSTFPTYTAATWDSNIANFNGTGGGTVTVGDNILVNDINFGSSAGGFIVTAAPTFGLNINGVGVTNNSAVVQSFTTQTGITGTHGTITFNLLSSGSATAGGFNVHYTPRKPPALPVRRTCRRRAGDSVF